MSFLKVVIGFKWLNGLLIVSFWGEDRYFIKRWEVKFVYLKNHNILYMTVKILTIYGICKMLNLHIGFVR